MKNLKIYAICLGILLFSMFSLKSENLHQTDTIKVSAENTQIFTTENGLPYNFIRYIVQDKMTGNIWLGTWDGLSNFTGTSFKNYYHDPEDSTSLKFSDIRSIVFDKENTLWVLTQQGLVKYDNLKDNFLRLEGKNKYSLGSDILYSIATDQENDLWAFCNKGLYNYNYNSGQFSCLSNSTKIRDYLSRCSEVLIDNKNQIWIKLADSLINCGKISFLDGKKVFTESYDIYLFNQDATAERPSKNFGWYYRIFVSNQNNIYLATYFGLFKALNNKKSDNFQRVDNINFSDNFNGAFNIIWACKPQGLFIFNTETKKTTHIISSKNEYYCYGYVDQNNRIWFSTINAAGGGGLSKIIRKADVFYFYLNDNNFFSIKSIFKDSHGYIWTGVRSNTNNCFLYILSSTSSKNKNTVKYSFSDPPRAFAEDEAGNIWIGHWGNMLDKYNYKNKKIERNIVFKGMSAIPEQMCFKIMIRGNDGYIYASGKSLLHRFNPMTLIDEVFDTLPSKAPVYSMLIDSKGVLWVGSEGKVYRYDNIKNPPRVYQLSGSVVYNVESIIESSTDSNTLWLTALYGGICSLNKKTGTVDFFTQKDGLSRNTTYESLKDKAGNIWISTNDGISFFNEKEKTFITIKKEDGLLIKEFNSEAAFQDTSGMMYFGGMGGFVEFQPEDVLRTLKLHTKPLIIEGIKYDDTFEPISNLDTIKRIILPQNIEQLEILYTCSDYFSISKKVSFRYRLKNYESEFKRIETEKGSLIYNNIKKGEYIFEIQITDNYGHWNSYLSSLIIINPPKWYQTRIVLFVGLLITILIILLLFYGYRKYLENKKIKKEYDLFKLANTVYPIKFSPLFFKNLLFTIKSCLYINKVDLAREYIDRLFEFSKKYEINNIEETEWIKFKHEITSIQNYLDIIKNYRKDFNYNIEFVGDNLGLESVNISILTFIIQPLIDIFVIDYPDSFDLTLCFSHKNLNEIDVILSFKGKNIINKGTYNSILKENVKKIEYISRYIELSSKKYHHNFHFEYSGLTKVSDNSERVIRIQIPAKVATI